MPLLSGFWFQNQMTLVGNPLWNEWGEEDYAAFMKNLETDEKYRELNTRLEKHLSSQHQKLVRYIWVAWGVPKTLFLVKEYK